MARVQQFACQSCGSSGGLQIQNPKQLHLLYCSFCKGVAVYDPEDLRVTTTQDFSQLGEYLLTQQQYRGPQLPSPEEQWFNQAQYDRANARIDAHIRYVEGKNQRVTVTHQSAGDSDDWTGCLVVFIILVIILAFAGCAVYVHNEMAYQPPPNQQELDEGTKRGLEQTIRECEQNIAAYNQQQAGLPKNSAKWQELESLKNEWQRQRSVAIYEYHRKQWTQPQ